MAPESYDVRPESLETFERSYASSKVKNENDAIRNRISDFDKRRISQPILGDPGQLVGSIKCSWWKFTEGANGGTQFSVNY